jgi:hypothetical protein
VSLSVSVFTQSSNETQQTDQQSDIIDLGDIKIDARVELPQIQIVDKRIEPDFEDVRAQKSYASELSGRSERMKFQAITSGRVETIKNMNTLLNKKRF